MLKNKNVAIALGILCCILVIGIFAQMKTVSEMQNSVGTTLSSNSELIDEVLSEQEKYNRLYDQLEKAEKRLEKVRKEATAGSQEATDAEKELKENNMLLGLTDVKGEGIIIKLDDSKDVEDDEINVSKYLVHEQDILNVVNELFNAGAEAISINEHRVISTTAIRCDGNIIRVNGQIITVPITIKAICSKAIRNTLTRPKGYIDLMVNEGVFVEIKTSDDIQSDIVIPKYNGVYSDSHLIRGDK